MVCFDLIFDNLNNPTLHLRMSLTTVASGVGVERLTTVGQLRLLLQKNLFSMSCSTISILFSTVAMSVATFRSSCGRPSISICCSSCCWGAGNSNSNVSCCSCGSWCFCPQFDRRSSIPTLLYCFVSLLLFSPDGGLLLDENERIFVSCRFSKTYE